MKDEYKILIGAIIVILIVLVGAYAMSGSGNPGPSVTPIVSPTTNPTPTAMPGGEGGNTPSATPTVVPTAEPSPTPTTEPESGVKLTEFGYWITYPPLDPQTWSNPPPKGPQNVVYFDPTSDNVNTVFHEFSVAGWSPQGETIVHRDGDLSGTVNVTIQTSNSSNAWHIVPAGIPYRYGYNVEGANITLAGENIYKLRFDPGVSNQTIYVPIYDNYAKSVNVDTAVPAEGSAKLTITGVDGGYSIGDKDEFTVNINPPPPTVQFVYSGGSLNDETNCTVTHNGDIYNITVQVTRSGDPSLPLGLNVMKSVSYVPEGYLDIKVDDFSAGSATTYVYVIYNTSYMSLSFAPSLPHVDLTINPSPSYLQGDPYIYYLDLALLG